MIVHQFSCYTLRPASLGDLDLAGAWTNADPDHAGRVRPTFWLERGRGFESWLLTDKEGPVYFFRGDMHGQELEVHIQFPPYPIKASPEQQAHHRRRMSLALIEGMRWLEQHAEAYKAIHFESRNPSLVRFAERHLGFEQRDGRLTKELRGKEASSVWVD